MNPLHDKKNARVTGEPPPGIWVASPASTHVESHDSGDEAARQTPAPRLGERAHDRQVSFLQHGTDADKPREASPVRSTSSESGKKEGAVQEGKAAWVRSLPPKLRLLRGRPKYLAGCGLQCSLLVVFVLALVFVLSDCNDIRYVSIDDQTSNTHTQDITCIQPPREISSSYYVTENNVWSNNAATYDSQEALKEVDFLAYTATVEEYINTTGEINLCIEDLNAFTSNNTPIFNLLYMDFNPCNKNNVTVATPIHWPFVFDSTLVRFYFPDLQAEQEAGALTREQVLERCAMTAERSGDVTNLHVDCSPECRAASADADAICTGGMYRGFGGNKTVADLTVNPASLARCLAVNHGIVPWDYTDDLTVITGDVNSFYSAVYTNTEFSNELVFEPGACDLHFKGYDTTEEYEVIGDGPLSWFRPTVAYDTASCNNAVCGDNTTFENCSFTFDSFDLAVTFEEFYTKNTFVLNTFGNLLGLINVNQFTYLTPDQTEDDNPACKPLVTPLTTTPPEPLLESFWDCEGMTCPSTVASVGEAFANATLVEELLLTMVVAAGVWGMRKYYRRKPEGAGDNAILMEFEDEDVELAMWEAGIERLHMKEKFEVPTNKLFFQMKSMRDLGAQPDKQRWEEVFHEAWDSKQESRSARNLHQHHPPPNDRGAPKHRPASHRASGKGASDRRRRGGGEEKAAYVASGNPLFHGNSRPVVMSSPMPRMDRRLSSEDAAAMLKDASGSNHGAQPPSPIRDGGADHHDRPPRAPAPRPAPRPRSTSRDSGL